MASKDSSQELDYQENYSDPGDFPTLTLENFSGSPKRKRKTSERTSTDLSLREAFISHEEVMLFLEQDSRLEAILRKLAFHELLSDRQLYEFSLPDSDNKNCSRFLRFLAAADASALLEAVVILMGADPVGRLLLRTDDPRVQALLQQSNEFSRPVNSPKKPYTDFYEISRAQLSRSPPPPLNFSPVSTQPMVLACIPGTPPYYALVSSPSPVMSPSSLKMEMQDMQEPLIHNIPDETFDERKFPFSVIRDEEMDGSRVLLTRTHTLYRESSNRCFLAFNVVFQPNQERFRRAVISMSFLPIPETKLQPIIMNIFPNPDQRWPTGPSHDLESTSKKNMQLTVGTGTPALVSPNVSASIGFEKSNAIKSASNSSLTSAGVATSKLTIVLSESQAGDGIVYSFTFAVVLDLRSNQKPDFSADLRLNCQIGNRSWLSRHSKLTIVEKVDFSQKEQLDGGAPV